MAIEHIGVKDYAGDEQNVAVDTVGTDNFQVVKLGLGADGALDTLVDSGSQTAANSLPVAIASDQLTALGQATMAASTPVTMASDQGDIKVTLDSESVAVTNADITSCKTALEIIDDWDASDHCNIRHLNGTDDIVQLGTGTANIGKLTDDQKIDLNKIAGASVAVSNGTAATSLRVTIASDSTGQVKLAASDGVDIGNVDVASIVPGSGATNLGKAEDAGHSSGDVGVMALAVRDDTIGAYSGAENDYEPLHTNANGALYVEPSPGTMWSYNEDETAAATDDEIVPAPGASLCLYVTDIVVTNDSTAAITIKFIEDTATAKTNKTGTHKIPASGGMVWNLRTPIKCTANKNFGYTSTGTSNFSVFVAGYTAP